MLNVRKSITKVKEFTAKNTLLYTQFVFIIIIIVIVIVINLLKIAKLLKVVNNHKISQPKDEMTNLNERDNKK